MQTEFFIALQLEVTHHFIERCAGGRAKRFVPPATLGATKPPKLLLINPDQSSAHGRRCRCAPKSRDRKPGSRSPSRDEAFSFRSRVLPVCKQKTAAQSRCGGRWVRDRVYIRLFGRSVG